MKVLSICQPWAWLIAAGYKPIENRTWSTVYRGPIAIHASMRKFDVDSHAYHLLSMGEASLAEEMVLLAKSKRMRFGEIIGVANLTDVVEFSPSLGKWAEAGGFCWKLAGQVAFPPERGVPWKGRTSLTNLDPATLARVLAEVTRVQGTSPVEKAIGRKLAEQGRKAAAR